MAVVIKPSRSDEVLEADQQVKMTQEVRSHFDSIAPKRPKKPNRSEGVSDDSLSDDDSIGIIPELDKFRTLQSQSHIIYGKEGGGSYVEEDFEETQYYKELNSVDKQHYTTGSGFIGMVADDGGDGSLLGGLQGFGDGGRDMKGLKSNPATNDWIPKVDGEEAVFASSKPNRSESC
ncbi:maternal effect embryo arrest 59 [Tasmannia lanceolata]|uniref:maternal effect embryo arrest 59 n=1 Tax=Tasmannia lanceolata TaxID=3420 RepID=UPI004063D1C4